MVSSTRRDCIVCASAWSANALAAPLPESRPRSPARATLLAARTARHSFQAVVVTTGVPVAGTIVHVDNRYLAVWVREHGDWKFVAYLPTPIIKG